MHFININREETDEISTYIYFARCPNTQLHWNNFKSLVLSYIKINKIYIGCDVYNIISPCEFYKKFKKSIFLLHKLLRNVLRFSRYLSKHFWHPISIKLYFFLLYKKICFNFIEKWLIVFFLLLDDDYAIYFSKFFFILY